MFTEHQTQGKAAYPGLLCFALSHFEDTACLYEKCVATNPASSKSLGGIFFPAASAHFVSLFHPLVILTVFPTFSLLLYLL